MRARKRGILVLAAGELLAVLGPSRDARACDDATSLLTGVAFGLLAPSDVGVAVSAVNPAAAEPVIGWSWQIPPLEGARHHVVPGVDLLLGSRGASWRVRAGYRYQWEHLSVGAGIGGSDGARPNLSPELGVRRPGLNKTYFFDPSLHLLARVEIDPGSGRLRGATFLLGWNLI